MATKPRRSTTLNNILPAEKKVKMPDVEHVVIDGDSAIYAVAWGPKSQKEMERLYDQEITNIMESLETPAATVYVKGKDNFRYRKPPHRVFHCEDIPLVHEVLLAVGETRQRLAEQQDLELEAVHPILSDQVVQPV